MLKLDITNFRNIRKASLHDDAKISLVVGYNEDGKSSLCGAIQFAITGTAFGLRGDACSALVTHGEERQHVRVQLGDRLFNRTRSGGDAIKANAERLGTSADVLPLLFNQKLVGDGGTKHMKAFLAGAAASRFDPAVAFVNDPEMSANVRMANRSGSLSAKQVLAFFEGQRAAAKAPTAPMSPSVDYPPVAEIKLAQDACALAQDDVKKAQAVVQEAEGFVAILCRLANYYPQKAAWDVLKEQASKGDALGARRLTLTKLVNINASSLSAIAAICAEAGFTDLSADVNAVAQNLALHIVGARDELKQFPPPPSLPPPPALVQSDMDFAAQLGISTLAQVQPVLSAATLEAQTARKAWQGAEATYVVKQSEVDRMNQCVGAWKSYEDSLPRHEEAVARIQAEWKRWDNAAKSLQAAERDFAQVAGNSFAELVSNLGGFILQGRKVTVDLENGMRIGNDSIELLSESTKWRAEVATLAGIAITTKSPLLVIDGADVLDERNKLLFVQFLLEQIAPHFEHVLVTSTVRGRIEDEAPSTNPDVSKWILRSGELTKLVAAVRA